MATYKVRKELETPLLVFGCKVRYFYVFAGIAGGFVLFLLGGLVSAMSSGNWTEIGIQIVTSFLILVWLAYYLKRRSRIVKYDFKKRELTITNRDILNNL